MKAIKRSAVGLSLALAIAGHAPGRARAAAIAGYVSGIDGRAADCLILRGREKIPARYWADLRTGDRVVANRECRVELMLRDGPHRWTVVPSNSPADVTVTGTRTTPLPGIVAQVGQALTQWSDALQPPLPPPVKKGRQARQVALRSPAPPPPPPLAALLLTQPAHQHFVSAARRFNFAWTGGKPPFVVTVAPPGAADAPLWRFEIGEERVVSSMIALSPGVWEVRVTDAGGTSVQGVFEAVEAPPMADLHDLDSLPAGIARVLAAARLANLDGGVWRLEAHAQLADAARDDFAAWLMDQRLLSGLDLPDPHGDPAVKADPLAGGTAVTAAISAQGAAGRSPR